MRVVRSEEILGSSQFRDAVRRSIGNAHVADQVLRVRILECDLRSQDAASQIARAGGSDRASTRVVVCSQRVGPKALRRGVDAGADSVVWIEQLETLPSVLSAVADGYLCLPRESGRRADPPTLTRREKQVLGQLVLGLSNREISRALGIEETTVKTHVRNLLSKLGADSRGDATRLVLDPNLGLGLGVLKILGDESASWTR